MGQSLVVSKFGGTSMGTRDAMFLSASICMERKTNLAVVSAMSETTDQLIEVARLALQGNRRELEQIKLKIKQKHSCLLNEVTIDPAAHLDLTTLLSELDDISESTLQTQELSPKTYDRLLSLGERMSSVIFKEVVKLVSPDKIVKLLDARSVIKTDSHFGSACPNIQLIEKRCRQMISIDEKTLTVTQGFIGSDDEEDTTILGRGGSDFSAALFAEGLNASVLEIWTDVAGIATTDPRLCSSAKIIHEISYKEAEDMALLGAKILHPSTIAPAVRRNIPIFVGSTFDKHGLGTWIKTEVESTPMIRAITRKSSQVLMKIILTDKRPSDVYDILNHFKVTIHRILEFGTQLTFTIEKENLKNNKLMSELKGQGELTVGSGLSLISLIGNIDTHRALLSERITSILGKTKVHFITHHKDQANLNFLVEENESLNCVQRLHKLFIEEIQ